MPDFKVVMQYTQTDHGFTEVYYRTGSTLAAAANIPKTVFSALCSMRHKLTILRKCRISDVLNNRRAVVFNVNQEGALVPPVDAGPDIAGVSAIVTLNDVTNGSKRQVWLRGLADGSTQRNSQSGTDEPSAALGNGINYIISRLAATGFTVKSLVKVGTGLVVFNDIVHAVAVAGAGLVTLTTRDNFNITASGRVILSQLSPKLFPGLNGHWKATVAGAKQFTVAWNSDAAFAIDVAKGRTRPEEYVYGPIDRATSGFNKFGTRDTGKNSLAGRGRRSAPRLRSA